MSVRVCVCVRGVCVCVCEGWWWCEGCEGVCVRGVLIHYLLCSLLFLFLFSSSEGRGYKLGTYCAQYGQYAHCLYRDNHMTSMHIT